MAVRIATLSSSVWVNAHLPLHLLLIYHHLLLAAVWVLLVSHGNSHGNALVLHLLHLHMLELGLSHRLHLLTLLLFALGVLFVFHGGAQEREATAATLSHEKDHLNAH